MNILLGVTSSVAVARVLKITQALLSVGHVVKIIKTSSVNYFWHEDWDEQFTQMDVEVFADRDEWVGEKYTRDMPIAHIELRKWADIMLIAPLTANTLAKLANGLADNLLTCTMRAWECEKKVLVAPAMNTQMWLHPATKMHLEQLSRWYELVIINPVEKQLACGDVGIGGIADTDEIIKTVGNCC